jgi:hypothetical protein
MRSARRALAAGLLLCAPMPSIAEPIQADRPGQADPAFVVGRGTVQIEMGATYSRERNGEHVDTWTFPEPLLRVGVLDRAELRLAADGVVIRDVHGATTAHTGSDLEVSTKIRILEQAVWLPMTSMLAGLTFPTGGRAVTSAGYDPFGTLLVSWQIGERFSVDADLGLAAPTQGSDHPGRVVETFVAASWGMSLSESVGTFLEYDTTLRASGRPDAHTLEGGLTYLVTDDLQLDVSAGTGLDAGVKVVARDSCPSSDGVDLPMLPRHMSTS